MTNKETAYKKISELVERFGEQYESYKRPEYNETQTRRDFIDPFFKALGWDIDNEQGFAEAYREVIHEDRVKVSGATKAPDYSFKLSGGKRLFFVEAKKPSVDVKADTEPAYQVRRYGWSAKLAISIITDFEEFSVYDCSKKPVKEDKAFVARVQYFTYKDYLSKFDFIWETFSKECVLKGSFDKFLQGNLNKKGTATVDKEFLQSLDEWRTYLATSISLNNKNLDEDEINFAVQQIIDRIIFLRIAEDRSIENYGKLKDTIKQGDYYQNLFEQFKKADEKYNSGLFDFKKDKISAGLKVDNKVLKTIINELYYPESPYEFSVLSVEILGSAYEQFLGKVIRITPAHHAKIEEKPEVRKAGGVYYTPQYIVDYIVQNTVGKLIEGKTPKQVTDIKIVDPACGSGSFLLGAFQFLLDWHKDYYHKNNKSIKSKNDNPLTPEGNLTTAEKKRILLNNIYGVDIDVNAVEVTKLSLLLKCLEGETSASISHQYSMFHERVLPTLDNNIKDGNSLIDSDFYDAKIDFTEIKKIKPFNWQKAFPEVFNRKIKRQDDDLRTIAKKAKEHAQKAMEYASDLENKLSIVSEPENTTENKGGFDIVIGNPPYVLLQNLETRESFDYASNKYQCAKYKIDTYQLFIESSINKLNRNGYLGFITPNTFLKNIHSEPMRKFLLDNTLIKELLLFNYSVFMSASVDTCIIIVRKSKANKNSKVIIRQADKVFDPYNSTEIIQETFKNNNRNDFNILISDNDTNLLKKIVSKSEPLGKYCNAYFGIQTYSRTKYVSFSKTNKNFEPVIDGANIDTYLLKPSNEFVNYIPEAIKSGGSEIVYRQDRICIRQIGSFPIATVVPANIFTLNTIYNVYLKQKDVINLKFLLGMINCKLIRYFWKKKQSDEKKTFPKIKKEAILSIPIISKTTKETITKQDDIVRLVEQILNLNIEKTNAKLQSRITQIESQIEYCEEKINEIVYKLYDLTPEEIKIVEGKE